MKTGEDIVDAKDNLRVPFVLLITIFLNLDRPGYIENVWKVLMMSNFFYQIGLRQYIRVFTRKKNNTY